MEQAGAGASRPGCGRARANGEAIVAMIKLRTGMFLAGAMAAAMLPAAGAHARNIKAKPAPAVCAEARARGQILPGCPRPDADARGAASASEAGAAAPAEGKPNGNPEAPARPS